MLCIRLPDKWSNHGVKESTEKVPLAIRSIPYSILIATMTLRIRYTNFKFSCFSVLSLAYICLKNISLLVSHFSTFTFN
jgi:hypothetical protein